VSVSDAVEPLEFTRAVLVSGLRENVSGRLAKETANRVALTTRSEDESLVLHK
jgi:hypothetical protein